MGATSETKDVFISYRRNGGATAARLLCDVLRQRNITTFFDKENLGEGDFDAAIEFHLSSAKNFILIVSQNLFDRGKLSDGSYDPKAVSEDWVYREIKSALNAQKPIIPIFVNGESGFPKILPPGIEDLHKKDALTLDHEHFDHELKKLISRLKTNKHLFIETYLNEIDNNIEILLEDCLRLGKEKRKVELTNYLAEKIRQIWDEDFKNSKDAIDSILQGADVEFCKEICKKLKIDNTGDLLHINENLTNWVDNKSTSTYCEEREKEDRYDEIIDLLSYRINKIQAAEIAEKTKTTVSDKRSSFHMLHDIFGKTGAEHFFRTYGNLIQSDVYKAMHYLIFNEETKSTKAIIIEKIIDYMNYRK